MRGFAPPLSEYKKDKDDYHHHHDPEGPKYQPPGVVFFVIQYAVIPIRLLWILSFFMGGYADMKDDDGLARGPYYHFIFSVVVHIFFVTSISLKKAFRRKRLKSVSTYREKEDQRSFFLVGYHCHGTWLSFKYALQRT